MGKALLLLKFVISAGLITYLLSRFDWGSMGSLVSQIDVGVALFAVVLLGLQYPLSAWKWQKSLQAHELDFAYPYLLRTLCVAFFFNNFLPTSIGGDAYRAYRTITPGQSRVRPVSAVVLERLLGILALIAIGSLCALILLVQGGLEHAGFIWILIAIGGAGTLIALSAWYTGPVRRLRRRLAQNPKLHALVHNYRTLKRHPRELGETIALSFLFQILAVISIAVLFLALDSGAVFLESGFVALASGIAGVLPLSINGIGLMEGSFTLAAVTARLPYDEALFVALSLRFFMLASSVLFGLLYAVEPPRPAAVGGSTE